MEEREGKREGKTGKKENTVPLSLLVRICLFAPVCVCMCVCVPPTSDALTRPSWKEQLEGSWVHKLRYLHQWQRKALFTHDRHLHGYTHTHEHTLSERVRKKQHSQGGAASLPKWGSATEEMSSDPKWAPAVVVPLWLAGYLLATRPSFPCYCLILILRVMCELEAAY